MTGWIKRGTIIFERSLTKYQLIGYIYLAKVRVKGILFNICYNFAAYLYLTTAKYLASVGQRDGTGREDFKYLDEKWILHGFEEFQQNLPYKKTEGNVFGTSVLESAVGRQKQHITIIIMYRRNCVELPELFYAKSISVW